MKSKLVLSLAALALVASSAMACGGKSQQCGDNSQRMMMQKSSHKGHNQGHRFIKSVMQLQLSDAQKEQIKSIMQEQRAQRVNPYEVAFSDTAFDKEAYIKTMQQMREEKIIKSATMMEKVYAVLDDVQKKELKVKLMAPPAKMQKMMGKGTGPQDGSGPRACDK